MTTLTFIMVNRQIETDDELYFVEAPPEFEGWLSSHFLPWARKAKSRFGGSPFVVGKDHVEWKGGLEIVGKAEFIRWSFEPSELYDFQAFRDVAERGLPAGTERAPDLIIMPQAVVAGSEDVIVG